MYTITLLDGTELTDLKLNGNNFIAPTVLNDSVFEGKLNKVTITDGEIAQTYTDMVLIQNKEYDGKSWFILAEKSEQQKEREALQAAIEKSEIERTDMQLALAEIFELIAGGM